MTPGLWTPDRGLPEGARADEWLREQRRRERYRWRHVRDQRVDRIIEAAAPTRVSYTEVASWTTTGSPKATASISWQAGDILVFIGGSEAAADTIGVPTATGLTFSSVILNTTAGTCSTRVATATAAGTSAATVNATNTNVAAHWGFGVWVWRSSTGVGNNIEQHTATKTKALTLTGVNSAVMVGVFDFNADVVGSGTPAVTNTVENTRDTSHYTALVFDNIDYSTSGSSWGQSGGGTTGPFSIVAIEIKNDGGGGATNWGPWMVNGLNWNRLVGA